MCSTYTTLKVGVAFDHKLEETWCASLIVWAYDTTRQIDYSLLKYSFRSEFGNGGMESVCIGNIKRKRWNGH